MKKILTICLFLMSMLLLNSMAETVSLDSEALVETSLPETLFSAETLQEESLDEPVEAFVEVKEETKVADPLAEVNGLTEQLKNLAQRLEEQMNETQKLMEQLNAQTAEITRLMNSANQIAKELAGDPKLEIHFISVGSNDAILLRYGDECAFIDGGNYPQAPVCVEYMKKLGITKLKYYIATHAHLDHVGAAPYILAEIPAEYIICNRDRCYTTMLYSVTDTKLREAISRTPMMNAKNNQTFMLGKAKITCVGESSLKDYSPYATEGNINCIQLYVSYGENSCYLTADADLLCVIDTMRMHPEVAKSSIIKGPHHLGGFIADIYNQIDSEYFVLCINEGGRLSDDQMRMAEKHFDRILATADDQNGTICFYLSENEIVCETQYTDGMKINNTVE